MLHTVWVLVYELLYMCHNVLGLVLVSYCLCYPVWVILYVLYCICHTVYVILYVSYCMSHTVCVILYVSYCMRHTVCVILYMSYCICHTVCLDQVWVSIGGNDCNFSIRQNCATLYTTHHHPKTILPRFGSLQLCLSLFLTEGDKCLKIANRSNLNFRKKTATVWREINNEKGRTGDSPSGEQKWLIRKEVLHLPVDLNQSHFPI